jgi:hypothetical protein
MNPSPFHPVTQFNCGQPLRGQVPSPIHPHLHDVGISLHAHEVCGIVDPISGDNIREESNNQKPLLGLISPTQLIESNPAASPAAGSASACECHRSTPVYQATTIDEPFWTCVVCGKERVTS